MHANDDSVLKTFYSKFLAKFKLNANKTGSKTATIPLAEKYITCCGLEWLEVYTFCALTHRSNFWNILRAHSRAYK